MKFGVFFCFEYKLIINTNEYVVGSGGIVSSTFSLILVGPLVAGVLQGYTLAPYLFIICLDYVLRKSIDKIRENDFELTKKRSRRYLAKTITDPDYADDIPLLANTPSQAKTLLHSLARAAAGIGLQVIAHKTEYMCFNQAGDISTLEGTSLKLVDKFTYIGKLCLINRKRPRHAANEDMDSYR